MSVGVICPSYSRPEGLKELALSLEKNSFYKTNRVYAYVDSDDPLLDDYKKLKIKNLKIFFGAPIGVPATFEYLAGKVTNKLIMMGNDDLIISTFHWDKKIVNFHKKKKYSLSFCNDLINFNKHCAFPIIEKRWVDCIGYTSKNFYFQHNDTWIFSIACMLGRVEYFENIFLVHNHSNITKTNDITYNKNNKLFKILFDYIYFFFSFYERLKKKNILKKKIELKEKFLKNKNYSFFYCEFRNVKFFLLYIISKVF